MNFLGVDYGEKHVGLALGDNTTKVSVPYKTIQRANDAKLIELLRAVVAFEGIDAIVVGVPRGGELFASQQKKNLEFAKLMTREFPSKTVITADESFTSKEAQKRMQGYGKKFSDIHTIAAMLILQEYLDTQL